MLYEVMRFGKYQNQNDTYDPTQMFRQNANRALQRVKALQSALAQERAHLKNYLFNHGKAIQSFKIHRAEPKDETEQ